MAFAQCRSATAATRTGLPSGGMLFLLELALEPLEPLAQNARRVDARQRGHALTDTAGGRPPPHADVDARGAGTGGPEACGPAVRDERALDRSPRHRAGRLPPRDDRFELDRRAGGAIDDPVRAVGAGRADLAHGGHEAREILEARPFFVDALARRAHGDRLAHLVRLSTPQTPDSGREQAGGHAKERPAVAV